MCSLKPTVSYFSFAIITSVALITASTLSPVFMSSSSTASLDMIAVMATGFSVLILIFAVTTPLST